jgi:hypothetical protein
MFRAKVGLISAPVLWSRLDYIINNDIKNLPRQYIIEYE